MLKRPMAPKVAPQKPESPNFERVRASFGGSERIRTAVQGFADLCLATRPRNPIQGRKYKNY